MPRRSVSLLLLAVAEIAACSADAPPPAARPPSPKPASVDEGWATSSWEDRHATMTWGVLPAMAHRFQAFRRETDPSLTCRTCHGADAEERAYAMPNRALVALAPDRLPLPASSRIARFMHDEVVPSMRELTEDPALSCFSCHPRAGEAAR